MQALAALLCVNQKVHTYIHLLHKKCIICYLFFFFIYFFCHFDFPKFWESCEPVSIVSYLKRPIVRNAATEKGRMNIVRPRLVTFDVTGTLLMTALEVHYAEIASQHGLYAEPQKLAASFKKNFNKLARDHPIFGKNTGLGWEKWWRTIVHNVFREQNEKCKESDLDRVAESLIKCYGTNKCWHKYPDTLNILEYLKEQNVTLGVISNFDARLESVLASTELRPYFSFVLSSYDHGFEKPDPSIFEEALKITNKLTNEAVVLPQESFHVGDTYDKDYLGAKNANWNAVLIKRDSKKINDKTKVQSENVFSTLDELRNYFHRVFQHEEKNSF